ncbi:MAG TPA: hypothetical protein VD993_16210 [Chitinophagaceae bacterium]|nr:hypothetical protein [Chitinophagaceae bacterium]
MGQSLANGAEVKFNSRFSFKPLIRVWESIINEGRTGASHFYSDLLERVKAHPELLEPIEDETILEKHADLIEQMMSTVFPVTLSTTQDLYAVSLPFQYKVIYASTIFRQIFLEDTFIRIPNREIAKKLDAEKLFGAYQLILNRLYNTKINGTVTSVHPYKSPVTGLDSYMELELDTRFIDVVTKKELPKLPKEWSKTCCRIHDIRNLPGLEQLLPIDNFEFEGMVIVRIKDVTEREIISKIKNSLLSIHTFADQDVFLELQTQIRNLLGVDGVLTAVKPFFKVNNHLVLSEMLTSSGVAKQSHGDVSPEKKKEIYNAVLQHFQQSPDVLMINDLNEEMLFRYPFLTMLYQRGFKNAIICPLFTEEKELLGIFILASHQPGLLTSEHAAKLESAIPLFTLALQKSQEHLDHQVDKVIKEQFTAVQDAVEWRFTEAALNYLTKKDTGEQTKIEPIVFEKVFPLYGAIDIRNSSVERNNAIQLDLLEQLAMAHKIVAHARELSPFPLLEEIQFKIDRYTHSVTNILFAEEELAIHHFLVEEIVQLFSHLQIIIPALQQEIDEYLHAIDSPVKMIYHHRKNYEESITRINNEVAKLIDHEQKAAQQIFPHYFERFVTDGLDFNIYIGQSISPNMPFDAFYLKNLKIWQLTTLVKAAQLAHSLQEQLPLRLQTTQLILAHSQPISISFRTAERKFDVDGAYNIRYEIIKKRIDKVHIKDTHERLTKPGTIAIVYSQPKEAEEYTAYIEFLQSKGLLKDDMERYDLEELQGVVGLRGLRVSVNTQSGLEHTIIPTVEKELVESPVSHG